MKDVAQVLFGDDISYVLVDRTDRYVREIRKAGESGEEIRIFACGGDGTLNTVLQEVMRYPNLSVTNFSCGTGNDYLKRFDNPNAFKNMASFAETVEQRVDVIRVNDSFSANVVCFGIDARICQTYERLRYIRFLGKYVYVLSALYNILKGSSQQCKVVFDDHTSFEGNVNFIAICNNGWYGGSFNPVPFASVNDGYLDVILCKKMSIFRMLRNLSKYRNGHFDQVPGDYIIYKRVKSLSIISPKDVPFNLDGEVLISKEANIDVIPKGLRFFQPSFVKDRV